MSYIQLRRQVRQRWKGAHFFLLLGGCMYIYLCMFAILDTRNYGRSPKSHTWDIDGRTLHRKLLSTSDPPLNNSTNTTTAPKRSLGAYPRDLFTEQQMKQGAIVLHVLGMIYMFIALAIVCDEFFVPSLEVIIEKAKISEDVAGATFMAAGGSAPELFTSIIGVFISNSNVGIGTIVGSAVFNILFVIGMCAMFSKGVLELTWWPLFRDVFFYSISLTFLIGFFSDGKITWWESILLLLCYVAYVIFMKFNPNIEQFVKVKILRKNRVQQVHSTDNLIITTEEETQQIQAETQKTDRRCSVPMLRVGSSKFRQGMLQLMIHTIDPLGEAKVHEKAVKLHAIASLKLVVNTENHNSTLEQNQNTKTNGVVPAISNGRIDSCGTPRNMSTETTQTTIGSITEENTPNGTASQLHGGTGGLQNQELSSNTNDQEAGKPQGSTDLEDENEPLDMSWPDTWRKRVTYVLLAPIIFTLWITLPDVRRPTKRKWFPISFVGSILWIGFYSYLLNWWAAQTGRIIGISDAIMGLTFLAAGTSIPDLITSVIVARKGFGDMAVSSSVGSNIFDVTVGLPFPWLLYNIINWQHRTVSSKGLFCSIMMLFGMLILVISAIAVFKWRMTKSLGASMFVLYVFFITMSLLMELQILKCFIGSSGT